MSRTDRIIGIVLGLVIGVVAVILFVFAGGSDSIDSPSLDGSQRPTATTPAAPGSGGSGPGAEGAAK